MTTATAAATQVYQLYIRASVGEVWKAITDPTSIARFHFGAQNDPSEFAVGSRIKSWSPDRSKLWTDNEVLECSPPHRLATTWRSLYDPELALEPESRVTWELDPMPGDFTRLTVTHDRLDASPKTAENVRGWSYILSNLKTLIETGETLPPPPQ